MTSTPVPQLAGYTVSRVIGSGGMSTVYEAWAEKLKRTVALKVLHPHLLRERVALGRFQREALSAARIEHPNVVRIYDYLFQEDCCCIVMEYAPGRDLDSLVREGGGLEFPAAILIMYQTALALGAAHRQGFMHRDVKPSNIIIRQDGRVQLMDFGLAHHFAEVHLTQPDAVAGTPPFMSPEQISGEKDKLAFPTDIYSWAVTFHFALTGRLPYASQEWAVLVPDIQHGAIRLSPDFTEAVPASFLELTQRCLFRDPALRVADGGALVAALDQCRPPVDQSPARLLAVLGRPEGPSPAPPLAMTQTQVFVSAQRRRWRWAAAGLAALLVAGTAYYFWQRKPEPPPEITAPAPVPETPAAAAPASAPALARAPAASPSRRKTPPLPVTTAAPESGQVFLFCSPWAIVSIDGKEYGKTPLKSPVTLPVGRHRIKLVNDFCEPREEEVEVIAGKVSRRRYQLEVKPAYR